MNSEPCTPTAIDKSQNQSPFADFVQNRFISTSTPCGQVQSPAVKIVSSWKSKRGNRNLSPIIECDPCSSKSAKETVICTDKTILLDSNQNIESTKTPIVKNVLIKVSEVLEDDPHSASIIYKDVHNKTCDDDDVLELAADECSIRFESKVIESTKKRDFQPLVELKESNESQITLKAAEEALRTSLNIDIDIPKTTVNIKNKGFTEFISNDEAENKDNNDPSWGKIEKLKKSGKS